MKRLLSLFLFLFLAQLTLAQKVQLQSVLLNEDGSPVADAHVRVLGNFFLGASTDSDGRFEIEIENFPVTLCISHLNYEVLYYEIDKPESIPAVVTLKAVAQKLPDITVSAKVRIDTVYQEPYSITDYVFMPEHLILLACKNSFAGFSLILLDDQQKEIHDFSLRDLSPKSLYQSCDQKLYLITAASVKEILVLNDRIVFGKSIHRDDFSDGLSNCVLATDSLAFFERYFYQGQALQYTGWSRNGNGKKVNFPLIEDERNIYLLIEESGTRPPWSGDVWQENISDRLRNLRDSKYALGGIMRIFFPPLNAPIYAKDSTLCIFNHLGSQIQYFSPAGQYLYGIDFNYHQHKKWVKKIYYDQRQQRAYTAFDTRFGLRFHHINMQTGDLGPPLEVPIDFVENVKVWNGYLYYLYRNGGQRDWNRKLYRMRLDF